LRAESERTGIEITTDKALFLVLIWEIQKMGYRVDDLLKAQKLGFLVAYSLFRDRKKAFSLEFFRYEHGPLSKAVYAILDEFADLRLLKRKGSRISTLSKDGCDLAARFSDDVLKVGTNSFCREQIQETAKTYGRHSGLRLRSLIYDIECKTLESTKTRKILDIPPFEHFTKALDNSEANISLDIPNDWLDTIDIMLSASKTASLDRALKSEFVDNRKTGNAITTSL